ncbi:MAG TPA: murein L,D-transpeptidase catalytic domain family protein [Puia sp.]|jgi:hypothetical protein|nr:murein L,D-transpeptidase catalytic domain family protein [Puia sp.]
MVKNLSRRTVKFVNVLCLSLAAFLFLGFLPLPSSPSARSAPVIVNNAPANNIGFSYADSSRLNKFYDDLQLDSLGLSADAYHMAISGFLSLVLAGEIQNPGVLSIIDFSKPSTQRRLFVLDMNNGTLLFNTLVAHGRNSGKLLATRFSNRPNSFMSSIGFYLTGESFIGQHGYSLRLEGKEKGWNDNAFHRSIIIHPAEYVSEEHIRQWGYLGRSEGCPAIPEGLDREIIDSIRGGSCLFIYSPDIRYLHRSRLVS